MSEFAEKLLVRRIRNSSKRNKYKRGSNRFDHVKKIGVLFIVEDLVKHRAIKKLVKELTDQGKEVKVLSFLPKDRQNFEFLYDFYTSKDLSFFGNINSDAVQDFIKVEFDYLFNFDWNTSIFTEYVLANTKAKCRIAPFQVAREQYYELMVKVKGVKNIDNMIREIRHYTNALT